MGGRAEALESANAGDGDYFLNHSTTICLFKRGVQSRAKLCSLIKVQQKSANWRFLIKLDQSVHSCHGGAEGI